MHLNHIVPNRSRSGSEIFPRPIFCQIKLDAEEELMKFTYPRQAAILFIPSFQNVTQKVGIFFFFRQREETMRNVGFCQTKQGAFLSGKWVARFLDDLPVRTHLLLDSPCWFCHMHEDVPRL